MIIEIIVMYPVQHRMNREYLDSSYMDSPRFRKAFQGTRFPIVAFVPELEGIPASIQTFAHEDKSHRKLLHH